MEEAADFRGWDLWIENGRFGTHIISKWPGDAIKVVTATPLKANEWTHVFMTYDGSSKVAGVKLYVNGVLQTALNIQAHAVMNTIKTKVPLKLGQRHQTSRINNLGIQDLRIYNRVLPDVEVAQLTKGTRAAWLLSKPADKRSPAEKNELLNWWLAGEDKEYQAAVATLTRLQQEEATLRTRGTIAYVASEKPTKPMAYILFRGDYEKRREMVEVGTPKILPTFSAELPKNRLGFAQWLVQPNHPLLARVTVNRFWQEVFGTGIVRTSGDFGISGEQPSHADLLDWLAVDFRENDWDVKRFFKVLLTSATYRQSALTTAEKREKDPANILLSRGPRFRMDAEMIRDYALASSGLLVRKLGGPSVRPYQPEGVWEAVAMIGSNTRDYRRDTGDALYRRSMYTFWKRAAPPASMDIFNAPAREFCTVRRERTNTPLQALVTLNDPQFVEAARHLAQRALKEGGPTTKSRIDFLAQRILARSFRAEELPVVERVLGNLQARYKDQPAEATKLITVGESRPDASLEPGTLAAWTMLVNTLLNLDEVLNK
jgi:hypothetical protein